MKVKNIGKKEKINKNMEIGKFKEYKGYIGSIEYSVEEKYYHGKVLDIKDFVNYESENNVEDLHEEFHKAVDDYIAFKEELKEEERIYHFSKEELTELQNKYYEKGINATLSYIAFCLNNSGLVINFGYIMEMFERLLDFIKGSTYYMKNTYNMSMLDYVHKYLNGKDEK